MKQPTAVRAEVFRTRDFTGWEVVDQAGEKLGTVADLLIDRSGRISFLDVEWGFPRKHVLVPQNRLDWGENRMVVRGWTRDQLRTLPPYDPAHPIGADYLDEVSRSYPWFYGAGEWSGPGEPGGAPIVPLSQAKDFRLAAGAPDPTGWSVIAADGERVGTVAGLLVDPAALSIRYLAVDLLDDLFVLKDDRHVLIPLEHVELKERGNDVFVGRLTAAEVARLPAYTGGTVEPWLQRVVDGAFVR